VAADRGGVTSRSAPGAPDLELALEETAWFEGDRIRRLEDRYDDATVAAIEAWMRTHGAKLLGERPRLAPGIGPGLVLSRPHWLP